MEGRPTLPPMSSTPLRTHDGPDGTGTPDRAPRAFGPAELDELVASYRADGFAVLRGLLDAGDLDQLERECTDAQSGLIAGRLDERHGTLELIEGDAGDKARRFANYVLRITELSPAAHRAVHDPVVEDLVARFHQGPCWSGRDDRFGFVYQDARPSPDSSYRRIGWHSDWQSGPHLKMWPSTAVTVHIDGTSPANGYLRVVPGSHRWATPAPWENVNGAVVPEGSAPWGGYGDEEPPFPMPLRFEEVPGELALFAEPGDVLFHDCYLWHAAAEAADPGARRRHVRGSWYAGERATYGPDDFVKNAAR